MERNYSYLWDKLQRLYEDEQTKIAPARFIPLYQTKNPQEQGKLEENFLTFSKYVSLKAEQDYTVKVSEQEGIIYLKPVDALSKIRNGAISVESRGDNVVSI